MRGQRCLPRLDTTLLIPAAAVAARNHFLPCLVIQIVTQAVWRASEIPIKLQAKSSSLTERHSVLVVRLLLGVTLRRGVLQTESRLGALSWLKLSRLRLLRPLRAAITSLSSNASSRKLDQVSLAL